MLIPVKYKNREAKIIRMYYQTKHHCCSEGNKKLLIILSLTSCTVHIYSLENAECVGMLRKGDDLIPVTFDKVAFVVIWQKYLSQRVFVGIDVCKL